MIIKGNMTPAIGIQVSPKHKQENRLEDGECYNKGTVSTKVGW